MSPGSRLRPPFYGDVTFFYTGRTASPGAASLAVGGAPPRAAPPCAAPPAQRRLRLALRSAAGA